MMGQDRDREPWINDDGSTNVPGWLVAYANDRNVFWRTDSGHIMNVLDELIDGMGDLLTMTEHLRGELYGDGWHRGMGDDE